LSIRRPWRRRGAPAILAGAFIFAGASAGVPETAAPATPPAPRIEVRSADLLVVGVVHDDKMSIHVSRLNDNVPVRDASISLVLRGSTHAAVAEADGGYSLQSKDLKLPGAAAVEFQITQAAAHETLKGTLDIADSAVQGEDKNNARQLWWWVLNFAVCFGILWLFSRRRKAAQT
jgi:hypothetical protein